MSLTLRTPDAAPTPMIQTQDPCPEIAGCAAVIVLLSPAAARRLIAASTDSQVARDRARQLAATLTEREGEVLACLGEGLSNAQIAARLYLSEATIKGYVSRTMDKLGCANRTQAGLLAHDAGLVRP